MTERTYRPYGSDWDTNVSIQEVTIGSGVFGFVPNEDGAYSADDVESILKAFLDAKVKVSFWAIWAGKGLPKIEPVNPDERPKSRFYIETKTLKSLIKAAKTVRLVAGKGPRTAVPRLLFEVQEYTGRRSAGKTERAKPRQL